MKASETFIVSFNRIERWLRNQLDFPNNMGIPEMVRRLKNKGNQQVALYEDDILQFAKLRNAIIHNKLKEDFIIAEPNEWTVKQIQTIEQSLLEPATVNRFMEKPVVSIDTSFSMKDVLTYFLNHHYSQYPVYQGDTFQGILTTRGIGVWLANEKMTGMPQGEMTVNGLLGLEKKKELVAFMKPNQLEIEAVRLYKDNPRLEVILITSTGHKDGELVGLISPKDLFD